MLAHQIPLPGQGGAYALEGEQREEGKGEEAEIGCRRVGTLNFFLLLYNREP